MEFITNFKYSSFKLTLKIEINNLARKIANGRFAMTMYEHSSVKILRYAINTPFYKVKQYFLMIIIYITNKPFAMKELRKIIMKIFITMLKM